MNWQRPGRNALSLCWKRWCSGSSRCGGRRTFPAAVKRN
nr:MAG TPA: hypothetical protein [Caudoviricetes sp.]